MIKKIKELSKIFNEDYFQKLNIYNKDTKKINKKPAPAKVEEEEDDDLEDDFEDDFDSSDSLDD